MAAGPRARSMAGVCALLMRASDCGRGCRHLPARRAAARPLGAMFAWSFLLSLSLSLSLSLLFRSLSIYFLSFSFLSFFLISFILSYFFLSSFLSFFLLSFILLSLSPSTPSACLLAIQWLSADAVPCSSAAAAAGAAARACQPWSRAVRRCRRPPDGHRRPLRAAVPPCSARR